MFSKFFFWRQKEKEEEEVPDCCEICLISVPSFTKSYANIELNKTKTIDQLGKYIVQEFEPPLEEGYELRFENMKGEVFSPDALLSDFVEETSIPLKQKKILLAFSVISTKPRTLVKKGRLLTALGNPSCLSRMLQS